MLFRELGPLSRAGSSAETNSVLGVSLLSHTNNSAQ